MNKQEKVSRVRAGGTEVTVCQDGAERIAAFRRIVERRQYAVIDGVMVDAYSASAVVKVYEALNEQNQAKYCGLTAGRMARIAFEVLA